MLRSTIVSCWENNFNLLCGLQYNLTSSLAYFLAVRLVSDFTYYPGTRLRRLVSTLRRDVRRDVTVVWCLRHRLLVPSAKKIHRSFHTVALHV